MADAVPLSSNERDVLSWAKAAIEEGEQFLTAQRGYDKFAETIDAIMGEGHGLQQPAGLANVSLNHFGKVALDMVAALTDIKPFWDYRTFNPKYDQQAQMSNKLAQGWWIRRHIAMKQGDVTKFAIAMGTGYAHQVFNRQTQDLDLLPEDPRDVIPIRPGSLVSIQEAFGVIIRRQRTVNYLRQRWPGKASQIKADRDGSYGSGESRVGQLLATMGLRSTFVENLYGSLGGRPKAAAMNIPTVDEFTCYVNDDSINKSNSSIWMGLLDSNKPPVSGNLTNWSYEVKPGQKFYPRKRCIIFTRSAILYDDASIYWHGMFPLSKLTLDPWPWTWLGKAPMKDLLPLHYELQRLMRVVAQHHRRVERPGLAGDKNAISRAAMDKIDTSREGLKIRHNPTAGKGVNLLLEPPLDQSVKESIAFMMEQMDSLSGRRDLTQLMNLGQVPAMETVDKILETMSPSIRLRSQVMESYIAEFAMMYLSNVFQFYTLPQRIAVLGTQGMTFEDFDYDPSSMIPDMIDILGHGGDPQVPLPRHQRAQEFLRYFTFNVAPGSLLASASITDKMMYVQLFRMGIMDVWTLLEKLGIPNVGDAPEGSIADRLQAQAQMGIGQANGPASGHPSSGQKAPRLTMKES